MRITFVRVFILAVIFSLYSQHSDAAAIKVKKAKGKQAVVVFQGMTPESGEVYQLSDNSGDEMGDNDTSPNTGSDGSSRQRTLGFDGGFISTSGASGFGLSARYGWNKRTIEYGGIFAFSSGTASVAGISLSGDAFGVGGFFDYNFNPNKAGVTGVLAASAEAEMVSSSGSSATVLSGGLSYKWFILGTSTCIRGDGFFSMYSSSGTSSSSILFSVGLQTYF